MRIPLGDWGFITVLGQSGEARAGGAAVVAGDADGARRPSRCRPRRAACRERDPDCVRRRARSSAGRAAAPTRRPRRPPRPPRPRRPRTTRTTRGPAAGQSRDPGSRCRWPASVPSTAVKPRNGRQPKQRGARPVRAGADRDPGADRRRLRLPGLRALRLRRHVRRAARRRLRRLASRGRHLRAARCADSWRSPTEPSSRSAGTTSAATGSGSATAAETSSTTPIWRPTRAWP